MTDQDHFNVNNFVSPQNQAYAVQRYHFRSQAFKELAFELHRRDQFPQAPSRRSCLFAMDNPAQWNPALTSGGTTRFLHEVRILDDAKILRVDASLLGSNNLHYDVFQTLADRYWRGEEQSGVWEYLVEGSVEVVQEVSWPAAPETAQVTTNPPENNPPASSP